MTGGYRYEYQDESTGEVVVIPVSRDQLPVILDMQVSLEELECA